jgi:flagellar FliL protein
MAKKPAKKEHAEAASAEGDDAAKAKKKKMMIIGGAALVVVLLGGGAGAYFMGVFSPKKDEHAGAGHPMAPAKTAVFVNLPDMTVNLSTVDSRATFLKLKIALEVSDKAAIDKINPVLPRVIDAFQIYLRELRSSDLNGSAGLFRVKEELQKRINVAIYPARVDAVLIQDLLIQ